MDPLFYVVGGVVIIGGAWWISQSVIKHWYGTGLDKELQDVADAVEQIVDNVVDDIQEEIAEAKQKVKAKLDEVPTTAELKKLTKAKLEELGRELGIELDKRKTKDNMIKELKDKVGK
jgi:adenylate kinase family enzyme